MSLRENPLSTLEITARSRIIQLLVFALCSCFSVGVSAAEGQIKLTMTVEQEVQVTDADGETHIERVEPKKVLPGEEVIYTITYQNVGEEPATDVAITNAIPAHMDYVAASATGANTQVLFSVDGGQVYGPPGTLTVTDADGNVHPAGPKDYTHIRWQLQEPVPSGTSGQVSYQARLR